MKIAFVWYWDKAEWVYPNWRDGLRAAIEEIGKENEVEIFLGIQQVPTDNYDAILFWGDSNDRFFAHLGGFRGKKGIILTTNPTNFDNLKLLDTIFCESQPVYDEVRRAGLHAVKAFGTDTNFYTPDETIKKDIPYFYPATFSPWKRQDTLAHLGDKLWLIGTVQPDGKEIAEKCISAKCHVAEGYFNPKYIKEYYNRAENVPIPAIHGSERTVLEAMSMDLLPDVNLDNIRTHSYIDEYLAWKAETGKCPRDFVLEKYDPKQYAEKILKGLS